MLRFMGSQRVGYDWATDLIWWQNITKEGTENEVTLAQGNDTGQLLQSMQRNDEYQNDK